MSQPSASALISSPDLEEDLNYQPYARLQSSVPPSRHPTTGGGSGGDDQSDQPPMKKRPKPELLDPSPNPATDDDMGKTHYENPTSEEISSSIMDPSLALIHRSIINKYGDIGRECPLVDPKLRAYILESICKVVNELKGKTLETLDENNLSTYDLSLRDAEFLKFDVKWLRQRLDELRDAVKAFAKTKQAKIERNKLMADIEDLNRRIQILNDELCQLKFEGKRRELVAMTNGAESSSFIISGVKAEAFESPPKSIENENDKLEAVGILQGYIDFVNKNMTPDSSGRLRIDLLKD